MAKRNQHARDAADHHSTLNTFAAVIILLEGSLIYDQTANRTANKIIKLCKEETQRQLAKMDAAFARADGVAPTQAPSAPTRLMLEAGKGALWHASCREIEPTDDEIAAVWKAMEQARTDGVKGRAPTLPRRPTDDELRAWIERHDLGGISLSDARCVFEDAQSLHLADGVPGTFNDQQEKS